MFYRSAAIRFCSPSFAAVSLEAGETQLPGSRINTRHVMATSPPLRMAGVFLYVKSILVHAWLMQETIGLYITYSLLFKKKRKHFNIGNPNTNTENELTRPYQRLSYFSDPVPRFPTSSGHGQQKCSLVLSKKLIMHISYVGLPKQGASVFPSSSLFFFLIDIQII